MDHQVNEEIRDKEIRLISETGAQLGIMRWRKLLKSPRAGFGSG
jgi:translation initiation factor IF-3